MSYHNKRGEDPIINNQVDLFYNIEKTAVLQEARIFNETHINPRRCRILLTKIIFILYSNNNEISTLEATDLFFNVIKLFQTKDASIRQMMYIVIKELSNISEDVIMVTQSLIKDVQSKQDDDCRSSAIRALCSITDPSMLQGIERILKQSIVDKSSSVSSAALVSSYHLHHAAKDIVKRWTNEVQEAVSQKRNKKPIFQQARSNQAIVSTSNISQYHAIGLLYSIRQHDRMAVTKLIQNFSASAQPHKSTKSNSDLSNPAAICMLIRYASKIIHDDPGSMNRLWDALKSFLKHKSDMVSLEAARAICGVASQLPAKELVPVVEVLRLFLSSPKPVLRFASIRILSKLSSEVPASASSCNHDIESLIADQNRTISILAITTLLRTGTEASMDRLMKQMDHLMNEVTDDFKMIIVEAIHTYCLKSPNKYSSMLSFLGNALMEEGGYTFKKAIVEAMLDMARHIQESKTAVLSHLCELIEDCEFPKLSVKALHFLGSEGSQQVADKSKDYIRCIYNRITLDNAMVRAAAVSALVKFGIHTSLSKSVQVLLTRCLNDSDDEVRDRATLGLAVISNGNIAKSYLVRDALLSKPSLETLEAKLIDYLGSSQKNAKQFNLTAAIGDMPDSSSDSLLSNPATQEMGGMVGHYSPGTKRNGNIPPAGCYYDQQQRGLLLAVPLASTFGALFKSSEPMELTESETEYIVKCTKHIFDQHIVFQFDCTNTLNDQLLEDVYMTMQPQVEGLVQIASVPADRLKYGVTKSIYVAFVQQDSEELANVSFRNALQFQVKDCDPVTGEADPEGYQDEYQVDDAQVLLSDYIKPTLLSDDFATSFEALGSSNEVLDTFILDREVASGLEAACASIIDILGMQALYGTEKPKSTNMHELLLSGIFLDGSRVLCKCKLKMTMSVVAFELTVRSEDKDVSQVVLLAIS